MPKYEWDRYLGRMRELYIAWKSIPTIWREIQDPAKGFTPSLGSVYAKFRSLDYPTDHLKRGQFINKHAFSPTPNDLTGISTSNSVKPQSGTTHGRIQTDVISGNNYSDTEGMVFENGNAGMVLHENTFVNNGSRTVNIGMTPQSCTPYSVSSFHSTGGNLCFSDPAWLSSEQYGFQAPSNMNTNVVGPIIPADASPQIVHGASGTMRVGAKDFRPLFQIEPSHNTHSGLHIARRSQWSHEQVASVAFHEQFDSWEENPWQPCVPTPGTRYSLELASSLGSRSRRGKSRAGTPLPQQFLQPLPPPTGDSGYASSCQPSILPDCIEEDIDCHPESLTEFGRLYRTPCCYLHEFRPHGNDETQFQPSFKDIVTCSRCLHTRLHTLSWSARRLSLEVFLSQLENVRSEAEGQGISNEKSSWYLTSLDRAGNSSLHYAAAGGATFAHFQLLMRLGISSYQLNTAGQLFLHCWKPRIDYSVLDSVSQEPQALRNDIESLLKILPPAFFRWRDNEGKTVLDSLACVVKDEEFKQHIFELFPVEYRFRSLTYSPTRVPENHEPSVYSSNSPDVFKNTVASSDIMTSGGDFQLQQRSLTTIVHATMDPGYVDPETGDSVLHALSRLTLDTLPRHELLSKIRHFVSADVDINLPNKEMEYPLVALLRGRRRLESGDAETGAQKSKYLETLIWMDPRATVPSRINVNIQDAAGLSALCHAALMGQPESVKSLIDGGANVNARIAGHSPISILQAACNARDAAIAEDDAVKVDRLKNVIDHLTNEGAVLNPTITQERQLHPKSLLSFPN